MATGIVIGIVIALAFQRVGRWFARQRRFDPWRRALDNLDGPLL